MILRARPSIDSAWRGRRCVAVASAWNALPNANRPSHGLPAASLKGRSVGAELVEQAPQRPHVALGVVRAVTPDLGRDVIRRPHLGARERLLALEHLTTVREREL